MRPSTEPRSPTCSAPTPSIVAFDLTGVRLIPSGILGLFVSLTRLPDITLRVQIFNPSAEIREILRITRLDRMIEVHEVDLSGS